MSFVDFGPTVLSRMGVAPDPRFDGRAFLGAHATAPREFAFFHADRFDGAMDRARGVTDWTRLLIRNHLSEVPHLIANAYRERRPMTQDLYDLWDSGPAAWRRTPSQWQVGSLQRPEFEWYDRRDDPWEVRNLVGADFSSSEEAAFRALDAALARWCEETGDFGLVADETTMVRERLWPPVGEPPTTAPPSLDASGHLTSPTSGAWIAVRPADSEAWRPYNGESVAPAHVGSGTLKARAHRFGDLPSEVVRLDP